MNAFWARGLRSQKRGFLPNLRIETTVRGYTEPLAAITLVKTPPDD